MFGDEYTTKPYVIEDVLTQIQMLREMIYPSDAVPTSAPAPTLLTGSALVSRVLKKGLKQTSIGGKRKKTKRKRKQKRRKTYKKNKKISSAPNS